MEAVGNTAAKTSGDFFENSRGGGGAPASKNNHAFSRFHRVKFAANGAIDQKWVTSGSLFDQNQERSGENRPANMNTRDSSNRVQKPSLVRNPSFESLCSSVSQKTETNWFVPQQNRFVPQYKPLGRRSEQSVTGKITAARIPRRASC